jgi:hypothetical protein
MSAPEPFEPVFGYVVSVEGSDAYDRCRAVIAYANAAPYDPLFFEGIKFYDAALPGVEQFHAFARLTVYNSPQGPLAGNHPRIDLPPH